jgi:3-mercaptopyruvate sulfurtransferase SseA
MMFAQVFHRQWLLVPDVVESTRALSAERVITYCGAGNAARSDALALTLLGHRDVAVYDGSLAE